jgi:hypothetical protein
VLFAIPHDSVRSSVLPDASAALSAGLPMLMAFLVFATIGVSLPAMFTALQGILAIAASYAFGKVGAFEH